VSNGKKSVKKEAGSQIKIFWDLRYATKRKHHGISRLYLVRENFDIIIKSKAWLRSQAFNMETLNYSYKEKCMRRPLKSLVFALSVAALFLGCNKKEDGSSARQDEPPMTMGGTQTDQKIRETKLVELNMEEDRIVYEVSYPVYGLKSIVKLGFVKRGMREEVFENRWKVVYEYNKNWDEYSQIPAAFTIYKYSDASGKYDILLNKYVMAGRGSKGFIYTDSSGRQKEVEASYFILLGHMGGG